MKRIQLFLFIWLLFYPIILPGQTRGVGKLNAEPPISKQGRFLLFTIGIDQYDNWLNLHNAVSDAKGVAALLTQQFGFTPILAPLYNEKATRVNILRSFDELRHTLHPDDNLLIFFAGHGHTRLDTIGAHILESGYLIPADGEGTGKKNWSSFLNINHFLDRASMLPARHVTVVLDACHSGFGLGRAASDTRGAEEWSPALTGKVSRRVITSARRNQLALDSGPMPRHSLFTGALIQGLQEAKADLNRDGVVTTSELGLYLQQNVSEASGGTQTPDFGAFDLDERGEMILELNSDAPATLINNGLAQLRSGQLNAFRNTFHRLQKLDLPLSQIYYLQYRYAILENDIDLALKTLKELVETMEGKIEANNLHAVFKTRMLLEYWSDLFRITNPIGKTLTFELVSTDADKARIEQDSFRTTFRFPIQTSFQIKITNNTSAPCYVYCLLLDEDGQIEVLQLWEDPELRYGHGLLPGASELTYTFQHPNLRGIEYVRMFSSPEPIDAFVSPPSFIRTIGHERPLLPERIKTHIFELAFADFPN